MKRFDNCYSVCGDATTVVHFKDESAIARIKGFFQVDEEYIKRVDLILCGNMFPNSSMRRLITMMQSIVPRFLRKPHCSSPKNCSPVSCSLSFRSLFTTLDITSISTIPRQLSNLLKSPLFFSKATRMDSSHWSGISTMCVLVVVPHLTDVFEEDFRYEWYVFDALRGDPG